MVWPGFLSLLQPEDASVARIAELLQREPPAPGGGPRLTENDLEELRVLLGRKLGDGGSGEPGGDRYEAAAESLLREEGTDLVVLGHTHRARCVALAGGTYLNTGAWAHRLRLPEACLSAPQAVEEFRAYLDSLLRGTFESWTSARPTYADIRLSADGAVEAADLCEFRQPPVAGEPRPPSTSTAP